MMYTMHAALLINSDSRRGDASLQAIRRACKAHGITIDHEYQVTKRQPLNDLLQQIAIDKPSLLLIGGGDGTVSHGIASLAQTGITFGVIPLGTTNNFARSLGLPQTIYEAVGRIAAQKPRPIDLGKIADRYFANVVGIGLSATIAQRVDNKAKRYFGRAAYALVGARALITHRSFRVTLQDKDGELTNNFETHQLIVANGRFHGGRQIALDAEVDNRELIVFALGGKSKLSLIWRLLDFYIGRRKKVVHASYMTAKYLRIETDRKQPIELDGETLLTTPQTIAVQPHTVRIRC